MHMPKDNCRAQLRLTSYFIHLKEHKWGEVMSLVRVKMAIG
jgi:hypothetical protein